MINVIQCPSCKVRLQVHDEGQKNYSCPRCLTRISGAELQRLLTAPGPARPEKTAAITAAPVPDRPKNTAAITTKEEGDRYCPNCQKPIRFRSRRRFCPYCQVRLPKSIALKPGPTNLDREIDLTQKATTGAMGVLGILGLILGSFVLFFVAPRSGGFFIPAILVTGVIFLISFGVAGILQIGKSEPFSSSEFFARGFLLAGNILFVIFCVGFAAVLFFFAACMVIMRPR